MSAGSACIAAALVTGAATAGPALADEGPTTNPQLNTLLDQANGMATAGPVSAEQGQTTNPRLNAVLDGAAGIAQQPLLPGMPPPPPGMDLNQWAMLVGSQMGVQKAYDGTSPIYDNGAIDGMNNSLGMPIHAAFCVPAKAA
jgi:hypothetical protein